MRKALVTALFVAAPRAALACPVCFGENDSPLALAMNNGILFMLAIVFAVLACFGAFFVNLIRRARLASRDETSAAARALATGRSGREGIAQC
jgi:hypothetical protein